MENHMYFFFELKSSYFCDQHIIQCEYANLTVNQKYAFIKKPTIFYSIITKFGQIKALVSAQF